jgi:hypothetical protein
MLRDVKSVRPLSGHRLHLQFDDGVEGEVDIAALVAWHGVFEPLRNIEFFRQVAVHSELGVVCWPNGADLDTDVLYSEVAGTPLPQSEAA